MNWQTLSALTTAKTRKDGKILAVYVSRGPSFGPWQIAALESNQPDPAQSIEQAIGGFFERHAHVQLQSQPTLAAALVYAEKYARWWARSLSETRVCPCKVIGDEAAE